MALPRTRAENEPRRVFLSRFYTDFGICTTQTTCYSLLAAAVICNYISWQDNNPAPVCIYTLWRVMLILLFTRTKCVASCEVICCLSGFWNVATRSSLYRRGYTPFLLYPFVFSSLRYAMCDVLVSGAIHKAERET